MLPCECRADTTNQSLVTNPKLGFYLMCWQMRLAFSHGYRKRRPGVRIMLLLLVKDQKRWRLTLARCPGYESYDDMKLTKTTRTKLRPSSSLEQAHAKRVKCI